MTYASTLPHTYDPPGTFIAISAGFDHNCAIRTDSTALCWGGYNNDGELNTPRGTFRAISAGARHSCGIKTNRTIVCWGSDLNREGEFIGTTIPPKGEFTAVNAAGSHTCAIKRTDAAVVCWGDNTGGKITPPTGSFRAVSAGGYHPTSTKPGTRHTCAIRSDATAVCWGDNNWGQSTGPTDGPPPPPPPPDDDGDGLTNATEASHSTDPSNKDTDGDGLWDSWEVDPSVEGAGFNLDVDPEIEATRDEVFGPYASTDMYRDGASFEGLKSPQYAALVREPDPLRKDIYLELDWQDCARGGCPTEFGKTIKGHDIHVRPDPSHHAPSIEGLQDMRTAFLRAPAENPIGPPGISVHVLVDEAIKHRTNCDQATGNARDANQFFGTPEQRAPSSDALESPEIMAAKRLAVRYIWSGHSTARNHADPTLCPNPSNKESLLVALGLPGGYLPGWDYSPFGDADVGRPNILVSLGPTWICPTKTDGVDICFRGQQPLLDPGIFPAKVKLGPEDRTFHLPEPMQTGLVSLSGTGPTGDEDERAATTQLWGRTVMHLLGHALGIEDDSVIGNDPLAIPSDGDHDGVIEPQLPHLYDIQTWEGLQYAPPSRVNPAPETFSPAKECTPWVTSTKESGEAFRPSFYITQHCPANP